ncbi:MAG: DUF4091 domain-containing protein, partial [Ruminococcaceae bacterium]|nr:DUF4091 domain-containing protein [Oscillospiraceae bacterium]
DPSDHVDADGDSSCDVCDLGRGSQEWPFALELGKTQTPTFTAENTSWYYAYTTTAVGEFHVTAEGADVSVYVEGKLAEELPAEVSDKDEIVVCISKASDSNESVAFQTSLKREINIVDTTNFSSYIFGTNTADVSLDTDGTDSAIMFKTTASADPYFGFNIKTYQTRVLKIAARKVFNSDYKYIAVKVKATDCSPSSMSIYVQTSNSGGYPYILGSEFIPGTDGWHYVYFNLSECDSWNGTLNTIRFDIDGAASATNTVLISSITGYTTFKDALCDTGVNVGSVEIPTLTPEQEAEKDELLSGTTPDGGYENYTPETAPNEDADINLWFNHTYTRTPQTQVTPGELFSYKLLLAKNETEGCQLILSSDVAKNGLTIEMTDFMHTNGIDTMESELLQGYYFEIEGEWVIDPIPPAGVGNFSTFDIAASTSQTFIVKALSKLDTAAGEYSATVTVKDADGNAIKQVTVFAYVWNFELPDASSCKTLMDLAGYHSIFGVYSLFDPSFSYVDPETGEMSDTYNFIVNNRTYDKYYDFLLKNRVCSYSVPDMSDSGNYNSVVMSYLNNPRVVAFLNLGYTGNYNATNLQNAYKSLTNADGTPKLDAAGNSILDKAYFYPVDEPGSQTKLDEINYKAAMLKQYYSEDYNLIAPMHIDNHITDSEGRVVDFFEYVKGSVTAWCPKTFFFTTMTEYANDTTIQQGTSIYAENTLGLFKDRMAAEQEAGNEVWWYVTRRPNDPEITLAINQEAVEYRILFWQQKLYNVDSFLYYLSTDWTPASDNVTIDNLGALRAEYEATGGWYSKNEVSTLDGYNVYGNGVLIYPGFKVALDYLEPVGSLRLECVRDGIEDFEYFTILEELIGKEKVDMIINEMTTSVTEYKTDAELFTALHEAIGQLIENQLCNG